MFSSVISGAVCGIGSCLIQVETDVANGLPCLSMVGYPGSEVRDITSPTLIQCKQQEMA